MKKGKKVVKARIRKQTESQWPFDIILFIYLSYIFIYLFV